MRRLVVLAPLLLAGCGTSIGNDLGLSSAGSAIIRITHTAGNECPDAVAQGAVPLSGFEASCTVGQRVERITVQSSDPTALITENNKILAGAIAGLVAKGAATAATGGAAALPLAGGSALAMPAQSGAGVGVSSGSRPPLSAGSSTTNRTRHRP